MDSIRMAIVDGDQACGRALAAFFGAQDGIQVVGCVEGGLDALHLLKREPVDLVLTDLVLPQMDGLALLEAIQKAKAGELRAKPKVLLYSAVSRGNVMSSAIAMGAARCIAKPADPVFLLTCVREACGQGAAKSVEAAKEATKEAPKAQTPSLEEKLDGLFSKNRRHSEPQAQSPITESRSAADHHVVE